MAVYRYLDASLEHVTRKDIELLRQQAGDTCAPLCVYPYDQGFFIPVPDDFNDDVAMICRDEGLSDAFINLVRMAVANRCPLLRMDWDADLIESLPVF